MRVSRKPKGTVAIAGLLAIFLSRSVNEGARIQAFPQAVQQGPPNLSQQLLWNRGTCSPASRHNIH